MELKKQLEEKLSEEHIAHFQIPLEKTAWDKMIAILNSGHCTQFLIQIPRLVPSNFQNSKKQLEELALRFQNLIHSSAELLKRVHTLVINDELFAIYENRKERKDKINHSPFIDLVGKHFFKLMQFPKLSSIQIWQVNHRGLLRLFSMPSLEKLQISQLRHPNRNNNVFFDLKALQEAARISNIKILALRKCALSDEVVQILCFCPKLMSLDLSFNHTITDKSLEALAKSSIKELNLLGTVYRTLQGTLALIRSTVLEVLTIPLHSNTQYLDSLTKEECEQLEQAFEENCSLLRVGIPHFNFQWDYPSRAFNTQPTDSDRRMSTPFSSPGTLDAEDAYPYSYNYSLRNKTLKEANESPEVFNEIQKELSSVLNTISLDPASHLSKIITSYAKPMGRELITQFNAEKAETLFQDRFSILKKFGFY